jgi:hypothetical protein
MTRDKMIAEKAKATGFDLRAWLEERCVCDPETGCLVWTRSLHRDGVIRSTILGIPGVTLSRAVWSIAFPKRPLGDRRAYPSCGNPLCLEPAHLKARTIKEAHQAAVKAGSYSCLIAKAKRAEAARSRATKYTPELAKTIRDMRAEGQSLKDIGKHVGMQARDISKVVLRQKWDDRTAAANSSVFTWRPAA